MSNIDKDFERSYWMPLLWIICLAFVSVGARNFEPGLGLDATLYATISRQIARTGEWFFLDGRTPDFQPFAEHPHLGFWLEALIFKVMPIADWSVRILGHLFYISFLWMLFSFIRRYSGAATAVVTVLMLWIWYQFSNTFSTFYLDPGVLFLGTASVFVFVLALEKNRALLSYCAGVLLALAVMYKGLTFLGFLPTLALAFLILPLTAPRKVLIGAAFVVGFLPVLGLYVMAVQHSRVPHFLDIYWSRQFVHRFGPQWDWMRLVGWEYWRQLLLQYTYAIPLLAIPTLFRKGGGVAVWLPAALAVTFICMFAPANLNGSQYVIMVMPWLAWLSAQTIVRWIPVSAPKVARATAVFCIAAIMVIQYIPVKTHGRGPSKANLEAQKLSREGKARVLYLPHAHGPNLFLEGWSWAWYADLPVDYVDGPNPPKAFAGALFSSPSEDPKVIDSWRKLGWCAHPIPHDKPLMVPCDGNTLKSFVD
jgi:4-amino-4-deoxy-L-arabinose transferase-like glycosyltransferase